MELCRANMCADAEVTIPVLIQLSKKKQTKQYLQDAFIRSSIMLKNV